MAEMNLAAVMEGIALRAAGVTGMERAYGWPNPNVEPPAFVVGYPDIINLDATMARGSDRATFPCWAVFGLAEERSARDVMSGFLLGLKAAIDGANPGVWQSARAMNITIQTVETAEVEYLSARFDVDVLT